MVTVERIRDDSEKRILRCSEGTRVWMRELQMYYIFFMKRRGHRRIGVLGKKRAKEILDCLL